MVHRRSIPFPTPGRRATVAGRIAVAGAIAAVFLYALAHAHLDLRAIVALLRQTNPIDYLAAILVFYASSVLRAGRWKLLLHNAGERTALMRVWQILMVGWFVNGIFPAKPGDVYRARLLDRSYKTSASKALGTIATERLLDGIVLVLLFDVLGLVLFGGRMPAFFALVLGVTAAVAVVVVAALFMRRLAPQLRIPVPARIAPLAGRFRAGLVGSVAHIPLLFGTTVVLWLMEGVRLYLVVRALPIPALSWARLTFVALAGSLLTAFPGLPGGLSLVEGGMVAVLTFFGVTVGVGLSVALLDRLINYWSVLLLSLAGLAIAAALHVIHQSPARGSESRPAVQPDLVYAASRG
jgi:glycosyltransferase 2 family protein